jgi:hypothetical protein
MKNSVFWDITPCRKKPRMNQGANRALLVALLASCFLLLGSNPENCDMLLRNVGSLSMDHMALYPRRQ